jgi:hypothetical protein
MARPDRENTVKSIREPTTLVWPDPNSVVYAYKGSGPDRPRYYRHLADGWELPGVTTILAKWDKGGLINWAADLEREAVLVAAEELYALLHKRGPISPVAFRPTLEQALGKARQHVKKKEAAADIGKATHARVQWEIEDRLGLAKEPPPVVGPESQLGFIAWEAYFNKSGITPLRVEQPIWSLEHGFAGTGDFFGLRDGQLGYVDYKTSKRIYPSQHVQAAAYCLATEELLGVPVEWAEIWRLPKSMNDLKFECVSLGELKVWNGVESVTKEVSRRALVKSFLGIQRAWLTTCSE